MDDDDFAEHNKKHSPDSDSFDDLPTSLIGEHLLMNRVELILNALSIPPSTGISRSLFIFSFEKFSSMGFPLFHSFTVTNIHSEVFTNELQREEIENVFKLFSPNVKFQWFRSFRRLRVNFDTAVAAANARIQLHQYQVGKSKINCYFAQPVTPVVRNTLIQTKIKEIENNTC